MAETVSTTDASGQVKVQSPQNDPTPKSKASNKAGSRPRRVSDKSMQPPPGAQGRPVTVWDNPEQDPNLRAHVGDSPDGADNKDFAAGKKALKK